MQDHPRSKYKKKNFHGVVGNGRHFVSFSELLSNTERRGFSATTELLVPWYAICHVFRALPCLMECDRYNEVMKSN